MRLGLKFGVSLLVIFFTWPLMGVVLSFSGEEQEGSMWCWAAVTQAVMWHNNRDRIRQCEIVSTIKYPNKEEDFCCENPKFKRCKHGQYAYSVLSHFGMLEKHYFRTLTAAEVKKELKRGAAIILRMANSDRGHYIVLYGLNKGKYSLWDPADGSHYERERQGVEKFFQINWVETFTTSKETRSTLFARKGLKKQSRKPIEFNLDKPERTLTRQSLLQLARSDRKKSRIRKAAAKSSGDLD